MIHKIDLITKMGPFWKLYFLCFLSHDYKTTFCIQNDFDLVDTKVFEIWMIF